MKMIQATESKSFRPMVLNSNHASGWAQVYEVNLNGGAVSLLELDVFYPRHSQFTFMYR